jgi:hypothetical protein
MAGLGSFRQEFLKLVSSNSDRMRLVYFLNEGEKLAWTESLPAGSPAISPEVDRRLETGGMRLHLDRG